MRTFISGLAVAAALATASPAASVVLVSNDFDAENGGQTQLDYRSFADLDVTYIPGTSRGDGVSNVNLLRSGDLGATCAGGGGACVDLLDGMLVTDTFSFEAGDVLEIVFDMASRPGQPQNIGAAFDFDFAGTGQRGAVETLILDGPWGLSPRRSEGSNSLASQSVSTWRRTRPSRPSGCAW